jgi:threonine dehydrogenase-like Zn-dependent dehydrogenase
VRAVTCKQARLAVAERRDPAPGKGQLLVEVLHCGICGSDLHARHHCDELAEVMVESGYDEFMRSEQEVVLGHEFCGTVAEHGPGCRKDVPEGAPVVALPLLRAGGAVHTTGLSTRAPGGYAERLVVEESLAFEVPNALPSRLATLTEPMAVGLHAVRRGEVGRRDVAIVIGCGPVGLAVISMLKAQGVRQVVASDFSPGRRELAARCGADVVVDPSKETPYGAAAAAAGHLRSAPEVLELAVSTVEKLRRLPVPWWSVWRAAERLGAGTPKRPVIFECVGVPGVIDEIVAGAPLFSRVVVVGVCMGEDRMRPAMAINKEIDLRFVVGYTPPEFRETLHLLADGKVDGAPLLTGEVGLDGVETAFDALGDPEAHAKILISPKVTTEPRESVRAL